jgi:hypothetical protein
VVVKLAFFSCPNILLKKYSIYLWVIIFPAITTLVEKIEDFCFGHPFYKSFCLSFSSLMFFHLAKYIFSTVLSCFIYFHPYQIFTLVCAMHTTFPTKVILQRSIMSSFSIFNNYSKYNNLILYLILNLL